MLARFGGKNDHLEGLRVFFGCRLRAPPVMKFFVGCIACSSLPRKLFFQEFPDPVYNWEPFGVLLPVRRRDGDTAFPSLANRAAERQIGNIVEEP